MSRRILRQLYHWLCVDLADSVFKLQYWHSDDNKNQCEKFSCLRSWHEPLQCTAQRWPTVGGKITFSQVSTSSLLDYMFVPNCLLSSIASAKTFEADPDNTSDHLPIQLTLNINYNFASCAGNSQRSKKKPKIKWSKFSLEVINTPYVTPFLNDFENGGIDFNDSGKAIDEISKLIAHHSASLADPSVVTVRGKKKRNVMSDSLKMLKQLVLTARLHLSLGRITIILMEMVLMKIIV